MQNNILKPNPPITPETNLDPLLAAERNVNRVKKVVSMAKKAKAIHPINPIWVNPVKSEINRMAPENRLNKKSWV